MSIEELEKKINTILFEKPNFKNEIFIEDLQEQLNVMKKTVSVIEDKIKKLQ